MNKQTYHFYGEANLSQRKNKTKIRRVAITGFLNENNQLQIGIAICSNKENTFNKKLGRIISTGKAVKNPIDKVIVTDKPGQAFINWCTDFCI